MEQPWYKQYFWLLVFGGIILITAIISFLMVCFCKTQFSRRRTMRFQRTPKQEKKQTQDRNAAVITDNGLYRSRALPTIILPEVPNHQYETIAEGVITNQEMYATVKKEAVTFQQQGTHSEYNGQKYNIDFYVHNKDGRYSCASYDSVGHITGMDYINTDTENTIKKGVIKSQEMYTTVKKEPVTFQQQGTQYNGQKYDVNLHVHNKDGRYSCASYDSVTDVDYINTVTENRTKDREYIEVIPDEDSYDDVEII